MRNSLDCGLDRLEPIATGLTLDAIANILAATERFARAPPG